MAYTFTPAQQQELEVAFNIGLTVNWQPGTHQAFSTLTRGYTNKEGELHWQRGFTDFQSITRVSEI